MLDSALTKNTTNKKFEPASIQSTKLKAGTDWGNIASEWGEDTSNIDRSRTVIQDDKKDEDEFTSPTPRNVNAMMRPTMKAANYS